LIENFCGWLESKLFVGEYVKKIGGHLKCMMPKGGWERGMSEESADDIIDGTDFSLGFSILRRCMRARESKSHSI
jgi:hypothetical protein